MSTYIRGLAEGYVDGLEIARDLLKAEGLDALTREIARCKKRLESKNTVVARPPTKPEPEKDLPYSTTAYFRNWARQFNNRKLLEDIEYGRKRLVEALEYRDLERLAFWARHNAVYRAELMGREKWGWFEGDSE